MVSQLLLFFVYTNNHIKPNSIEDYLFTNITIFQTVNYTE